jgi:hypothetical protein
VLIINSLGYVLNGVEHVTFPLDTVLTSAGNAWDYQTLYATAALLDRVNNHHAREKLLHRLRLQEHG